MNAEKIDLLRNGFRDIYKRVDVLRRTSQKILESLEENDVLLIEGDNGALTYLGYVNEVHLPDEHYKGTAAIPFVLDNKYGLGIPIEFQDGKLRQVAYNSFIEPLSNQCVLYSDFKAYCGIDDVDKQLRSVHHRTTFEKFLKSLEI